MKHSPPLLHCAELVALNSGDFDETQQAIRVLDANAVSVEGQIQTAVEVAAQVLANELTQLRADNARLTGICQRLEKCVAEGLTKSEADRLKADNARLRDMLSRADAALDNCGIGAAAPVRVNIKAALAEGGGK